MAAADFLRGLPDGFWRGIGVAMAGRAIGEAALANVAPARLAAFHILQEIEALHFHAQ